MTPIAPLIIRNARPWRLSALACLAAFALAPVHATAAVSCTDSLAITSHIAYAGKCQDPVQGNITGALVATFGEIDFAQHGKGKGNGGPFDDVPHGKSSGTLKLSQSLFGQFVLGIKVGSDYSLYFFDADEAGVEEIDFDILGVSKGKGSKLSQAFLFTPVAVLPLAAAKTGDEPGTDTPTVAPAIANVPEPGSTTLVLAALAAVGLTARRRAR